MQKCQDATPPWQVLIRVAEIQAVMSLASFEGAYVHIIAHANPQPSFPQEDILQAFVHLCMLQWQSSRPHIGSMCCVQLPSSSKVQMCTSVQAFQGGRGQDGWTLASR